MKLKGKDQPISLYRTGNATRQMEDVSVVLPNDVSIPGCTEIEIGAVIRGEVASGTMMVEQRVLPQEPNFAGYLSCRHTRGHNKSVSANTAIESLFQIMSLCIRGLEWHRHLH